MQPFDSARRELLKLSGLGFAAAAIPGSEESPEPSANPAKSPVIFDVRAYGATGDGKTVVTPAINRAIEAAAAAGGGTVIFPSGTYLCFSIHLKSHINLYLSQGATIRAADSPRRGEETGYNSGSYDAAEPNTPWEKYQDFGHNHWHNSLIWGESISDFSITGPGLIDGSGLSHGRDWVPSELGFIAEQSGVGNKTIALKNCRNVVLRDFSVLKGGHFALLLTGVDNLTIDNLKIDTNRDGIDLDCCKNVRVSNCTVNSPWDDAICPKSSFALGYARATENVTITNCLVTGCYEVGGVLNGAFKRLPPDSRVPRTGRIKCGTESNGGFKNITISNCVFEGCDGLALESVDGALLEDIVVSNITMRDLATCPIFMRLGARLRGPKESTQVGTVRRVLINNLVCHNSASKVSSILSGIPGFAIEDVKLLNIYIQHQGNATLDMINLAPPEYENRYPDPGMFGPMPAHGFFVRHLNNLEVSHVEIQPMQPDPRPAFYLEDVNRADFVCVSAPTERPAFYFKKASDLRIVLSRAAKDTQLQFAADQSR